MAGSRGGPGAGFGGGGRAGFDGADGADGAANPGAERGCGAVTGTPCSTAAFSSFKKTRSFF
jgi:hypothetical protein